MTSTAVETVPTLHLHVNARRLVEHQREGRVRDGLKSGGRHLDLIGADRQTQQVVRARVVGRVVPDRSAIHIGRRYGSAFDGRSAWIGNRCLRCWR